MKKNMKIRSAAKESGVYLWQIADGLKISVDSFNRKLRHELPDTDQERILEIIKTLASEKGE